MLNWLSQNMSVVVLLAIGAAYWLLRYVANLKAKQVALKYLAVAHKIAVGTANLEILALSKTAYTALPPALKPFVPATLFSAFVLEAYNEVVQLINEQKQKAEQSKTESVKVNIDPKFFIDPEKAQKAVQQAAQALKENLGEKPANETQSK